VLARGILRGFLKGVLWGGVLQVSSRGFFWAVLQGVLQIGAWAYKKALAQGGEKTILGRPSVAGFTRTMEGDHLWRPRRMSTVARDCWRH
jgi:hypothetical protein